MQVYRSGTEAFTLAVDALANRHATETVERVEETVKGVIADVRARGDEALRAYTEQWDGIRLSAEEIPVGRDRLEAARAQLAPREREALETASERIRAFHERQVPSSWEYEDEDGSLLGQRVLPLDRVGVYVPGGKAAYPSTVLMNVLPARVAGVREVYVVTPPGVIRDNPAVLAAVHMVDADGVFQVGGAQAVAALAYGTASVPRVDKIVGPGNLYVATAKRLVYGAVDIDMVAGPSEVLIVTDGSADPRHLAMDLLAQAEHDELAVPMLISTSEGFLDDVLQALDVLLPDGPWEPVARQAVERNGRAFLVHDNEEAANLVNRIAPEHLELVLRTPEAFLPSVRHAGAIFLGGDSAEIMGDYVAGPNHVLPTSGSSRFYSPLGVYDFVKRSSIMRISSRGLARLGPHAIRLARMEGLHAHARALEMRLKP